MSPYWSCKCLCPAQASRVIQGPWAAWHWRFSIVRFSHLIETEMVMGDLINGKVFQRWYTLSCSTIHSCRGIFSQASKHFSALMWLSDLHPISFQLQGSGPNNVPNIQILSKLRINVGTPLLELAERSVMLCLSGVLRMGSGWQHEKDKEAVQKYYF